MQNFKKSLASRSSLPWLFTFVIIFFFISFTTSLNSNAAGNPDIRNTASGQYIGNGTDNSFTKAILTSGLDTVAGTPDVVVASSGDPYAVKRRDGAIQAMSDLTANLYENPQASGVVWAMGEYNKAKSFNSPYVSAQGFEPGEVDFYYPGTGYALLSPMISLWQWARNFTYLLFVFIFVVLAVLVLFRQQLGGGTLVTISNSIPSIIWSMILVTLSYPIVGLFVDAITIGTAVLQTTLVTSSGAPGNFLTTRKDLLTDPKGNYLPKETSFYLQPDDPQMSIWGIWSTGGKNICNGNDCLTTNVLPDFSEETNGVLHYIGKSIGQTGDTVGDLVGNNIASNLVINLFLAITVLGASFKIFLSLLKNYVTIIMYAVVSPFIFLTVAFPGKTMSTINNTIKTLGSASLSFILIYGLFLLIIIIGQDNSLTNSATQIGNIKWIPPMLGYSREQFATENGFTIKAVIALVLFLFAQQIPTLVSGWLQAPSTGQTFGQIGQSVGAGAKNTGRVLMAGWNLSKPKKK